MIQLLKSKSVTAQIIIFLGLSALFVYINIPFTMPFILAGIFALGLEDFVTKISDKIRIKKTAVIVIVLTFGFALFLVPISFSINRILVYLSEPQKLETDKFVGQIRNLKSLLLSSLQSLSDKLDYDFVGPTRNTLDNIGSKFGEVILRNSTEFITQLPTTVIDTMVFAVMVFLLLMRSRQIKNFTDRYSILNEELTKKLITAAKYGCAVTLFSTLVMGIIQASVVATGSLIFREGDFWLVLAATFFLSFIPVIGAAPVGYLLSILAFVGGRTSSGTGLAVVATIAGTIDNMLRPYLVVRNQKISGVIGFTCVVGALVMLGFPGLLIGPAIMNLFVEMGPVLLKENNSKP